MRASIALLLLSLILAFTVFNWAGTAPREWNLTLLAICVLSLVVGLSTPAKARAPGLSPAVVVLVLVVFAYVGLQLIPLPVGWLRVLSPGRFEIVQGLAPFHPERWAPLSVSPVLTFAYLLRLLAFFLVFCLTCELSFRMDKRAWMITLPVWLIASIESMIGLLQHFETGGFATGTYANHGHLAGLLEMALPLLLALILITMRGKRKVALLCVLIGGAVLILLGLVYTASRMGLAACAGSMIVMALLAFVSRGNRKGAMLTTLSAVAALVILLFSAPLILVSRYEGGLTSEVRLQIWHDTLNLIANYPVFGCGLGAFVSAVQKYRGATPLALVDYAHSDYLQLLAELGAVGFLLIVGLGAVIVLQIAGSLRRESDPAARLLIIACAASLSAIAIHSLVDFQFYIPANMLTAAWIAGLAHGIGTRTGLTRRDLLPRHSTNGRPAVT